MLNQHTIDRLHQLRLTGMANALSEQMNNPEFQTYSFEERIGLLVDREYTFRQERRLDRLLHQAKLRIPACLEDIDYQQKKGLDRALVRSLSTCQWIESKLNVLITGPTGVGKTFLVCALGNEACRHGMSTRYYRVSTLLTEMAAARGDGSYPRLIRQLSKFDLLILDDWGLSLFKDYEGHDMLEVIEERCQRTSLIIASQLPLPNWHETLADPTLADAIMDRIIHNSYKLEIDGDSMRRQLGKKQKATGMTY